MGSSVRGVGGIAGRIIACGFDRPPPRGYNGRTPPEPLMPDAVTPEIFRHLVDLAALELDEGEAEYLRRQLNGQLQAIAELESIELDPQTSVTSHGVPYPAGLRSEERRVGK